MNNLYIWLQKDPKFFIIICLIAVFLLLFLAFKAGVYVSTLSFKSVIQKEREDAVKRSRAVLGGLAGEQVAPYLPDFPCNPGDCRFIGKPVDFIAFPGITSGDEIKEIQLIEVKTGDSALSKREKEIRECVARGKISYIEYRI